MRARQFIIEYDRAKTAQAFTAKLVNQALKDKTAPEAVKQTIKDMPPQQAAEMILQKQIEPGDPTKQKKFAQALALKYANGLIKWEDVTSTLKDYLAKFFKLGIKKKLKPEHSDFNRYKDLKTFYDAVDTYPDPDEEDQKKQAEKEANKGEAKLHYEDSTIRVIVPEDEAAACYYGQGTRWCTAGRTNNMFDTYNRKGPMYIIIPKNPRYTGEKYQLHFESYQYMDEKDEQISLSELVATYPGIRKAFADQIKKFGIIGLMTDEEIQANYPNALKIVTGNAIKTQGSVIAIDLGNYSNPYPNYKDADGKIIDNTTFLNNVMALTLSNLEGLETMDEESNYYIDGRTANLLVLDTKDPKKATIISVWEPEHSRISEIGVINVDGREYSPASAAQDDVVQSYEDQYNNSSKMTNRLGDDVIKQQWKVVSDMVESAVELMIKQQAKRDEEYRQYARDNGYNNLEDFDTELPYTEFNSYAEQLEILTQEVADTPLSDIKQVMNEYGTLIPNTYSIILDQKFGDTFKPGEGEDQPTSMPVEKLVDAVGEIKDNGSLDKDYEIDDTSFDPTDLTQESKKLGKKL